MFCLERGRILNGSRLARYIVYQYIPGRKRTINRYSDWCLGLIDSEKRKEKTTPSMLKPRRCKVDAERVIGGLCTARDEQKRPTINTCLSAEGFFHRAFAQRRREAKRETLFFRAKCEISVCGSTVSYVSLFFY